MDLKELMKCILDNMWDEVMGASKYMDLYCDYKEEYPMLAQVFLEIAPIELQHYEKLKKGFEDVVSKTTDVPQTILEIWKFDLSRLQEKVDKIKWKISNK